MKKTLMSFVLAGMMLFVVSGVMAQGTYSAPGSSAATAGTYSSADQGKMENFRGKIESVDQDGHSFTVQKRKQTMTFFWDDQTQIRYGKKTLSPMDLKAGERVKVSYREDGGKSFADKVKVSRFSHVKPESPKA